MEPRRALVVLRRRAALLVALVAVGLLAGFLGTSRASRYQATAELTVGTTPANVDPTVQLGQAVLALTLAQEIPTTTVIGQALSSSHVPRSVSEVSGDTTAIVAGDSNLIRLTVTDRDPAVARVLANAIASAFVADTRQIGPLVSSPPGITAVPSTQSSPLAIAVPAGQALGPLPTELGRNLGLGALCGIVAGILVMLALDFVGLAARTAPQLEDRLDLPVLGVVPKRSEPLGAQHG